MIENDKKWSNFNKLVKSSTEIPNSTFDMTYDIMSIRVKKEIKEKAPIFSPSNYHHRNYAESPITFESLHNRLLTVRRKM